MKTFTEWTVLPHDPIERVADNLWRVTAKLGTAQRQMMCARMRDGRVVVDNAIALEEPAMTELEAWGEPSVLVVPNGFHRQDAAIWKKRYPKMTVVAPPKAKKRVAKVVAVDATPDDAPHDADVRLVPLDGCASDALLEVRSGGQVSLVFCDAVLNMPVLTGMMGFMLGPTGRVSSPRLTRWFGIQDKRAMAAHLERLAAEPGLERLYFGHGKPVTADAAGTLRAVAQQLQS